MATVTTSLRARRLADRVFRGWPSPPARSCSSILGLIAVTMTQARRGRPSDLMGLDFFTSDALGAARRASSARWRSSTARCSASTIAVLIAVPVSIGIALFVTQVAPRWLRRPIVYVIDLLAVVPSVVFGLWGILVFAPAPSRASTRRSTTRSTASRSLGDALRPPSASGRAFMTAGIILAIMITPIITSITREVIDTVPAAEREGALGPRRHPLGDDPRRGAARTRTGGIVGAVMLGLGRAMGETIAVALVIGSAPQITANLFAPATRCRR